MFIIIIVITDKTIAVPRLTIIIIILGPFLKLHKRSATYSQHHFHVTLEKAIQFYVNSTIAAVVVTDILKTFANCIN